MCIVNFLSYTSCTMNYISICMSEFYLNKSINDDQIKLLGKGFHKLISLDKNIYGGGVTIFVKNSLHFILRNDLAVSNLESLWVEVWNCSDDTFLVCVLNRPQNSNYHMWDLFSQSVDNALECICHL